jgi:hypothetical protein
MEYKQQDSAVPRAGFCRHYAFLLKLKLKFSSLKLEGAVKMAKELTNL